MGITKHIEGILSCIMKERALVLILCDTWQASDLFLKTMT